MVDVPYCNVEIARPEAKPQSSGGIAPIPSGTSWQQAISIINNNFNKLIKGNYVEDKSARQTQVVRIYDPSNKSSFVDVRQITSAKWVNTTTGQTIVWSR